MGLRETLEAATPGEWWVDADEENLDVRAVEHAVARVAGAMTMEPDADPGVKARALADASLMALAPELASLVLDAAQAGICRRFTASWCRERPEISEEDWCAWCKWLARLDQIGKEG